MIQIMIDSHQKQLFIEKQRSQQRLHMSNNMLTDLQRDVVQYLERHYLSRRVQQQHQPQQHQPHLGVHSSRTVRTAAAQPLPLLLPLPLRKGLVARVVVKSRNGAVGVIIVWVGGWVGPALGGVNW